MSNQNKTVGKINAIGVEPIEVYRSKKHIEYMIVVTHKISIGSKLGSLGQIWVCTEVRDCPSTAYLNAVDVLKDFKKVN